MKLTGILLFLVITISSCSILRRSDRDSRTTELAGKQKLEYTYLFFEGNKQKMLGNYAKAADLFIQCIKISTATPAPSYEAAYAFNMLNKPQEALFFAEALLFH